MGPAATSGQLRRLWVSRNVVLGHWKPPCSPDPYVPYWAASVATFIPASPPAATSSDRGAFSSPRAIGRPTPVALCPPRRRLPCSQAQQRHRGGHSRLAAHSVRFPFLANWRALWLPGARVCLLALPPGQGLG